MKGQLVAVSEFIKLGKGQIETKKVNTGQLVT
jgi:hypothetical protein